MVFIVCPLVTRQTLGNLQLTGDYIHYDIPTMVGSTLGKLSLGMCCF